MFNAWHIKPNINTFQDWSGKLSLISHELYRRADTLLAFEAKVTTRTWIHGGKQNKICGKQSTAFGASHGDHTVFKWLAKRVHNSSVKLWALVQEKYSSMCQSDFSWFWCSSSTDNRNIRSSVVRRTKRRLGYESAFEKSGNRVNGGHLKHFIKGQIWQNVNKRFGQHTLTCPRRSI